RHEWWLSERLQRSPELPPRRGQRTSGRWQRQVVQDDDEYRRLAGARIHDWWRSHLIRCLLISRCDDALRSAATGGLPTSARRPRKARAFSKAHWLPLLPHNSGRSTMLMIRSLRLALGLGLVVLFVATSRAL